MDEVVQVTKDNCEQVAQRVVSGLIGRVFSVVTFYKSQDNRKEAPGLLSNFCLSGGYFLVDNAVTIKLYPRRKIFWDLNVEQVTVIFFEDGCIEIDRVLPRGKTIFRVCVV